MRASTPRPRISCWRPSTTCTATREQVAKFTVQTRAMPLGNETGMTDEERGQLGAWIDDR